MALKTLLVFVLVLMSFLGCKKEGEQVLATVGNHTITVAEWDAQYTPRQLGTPEEIMEEKRKVLDALIKEKLQLNEAEERGYAENEDLKNMLEERKKIAVVNQLYSVEVVEKAKVSSREIREAYDKLAHELNLKHILVPSEEEAKTIYDSLVAGADFDMLAQSKSTDAATKDKGGSLGWVQWGRSTPEMADAAYKLSEGEISPPFNDRMGWHILKLAGKRKWENVRSYEKEQKRIEGTISANKKKELSDAYLANLKERIEMTYNDDVLKLVAEKSPDKEVTPWGPPPLPSVSDTEREMVLVTTKKGKWTVGKVLDYGTKMPPQRPVNTPEGLKQWVDMLVIQEALVDEALKKRLDRVKETKDDLRRVYETQMVNLLHRDEVDTKAEPTEEEIEGEYKANPEKYDIPEKNWVSVIVTVTEGQAKDALDMLNKGKDFAEVAKERSIHPSKQRGGNMGIVYEKSEPDIFKAASTLKVGRLSKPFKIEDGWAIIEVTKREEKKSRSFEDAKRFVQRDLRQENLTRLEDRFIAELTRKYTVTIDEELLEKVGKEKEEMLKGKQLIEAGS